MVDSVYRSLSHIITLLFSLLCFYCEMVMSQPNWLIYSRINWSLAVLLIKTCNHLQGRKEIGWVGAVQMAVLDVCLSSQIYNL